jgi:very-short-patch-repair endonuclease
MKIYYNPKLKQLARNLRNNSTLSEVLLWNELKRKQLKGYQFLRQKPIGNFIVDFYCSKLRLAIEIDGDSHQSPGNKKRDIIKDRYLDSIGISVIRIDDLELKNNISVVIENLSLCIENKENEKTTP